MRVGIDARLYGPKVGGGGLGRYVEQLVNELQETDHENRFVLFLKKENFDACRITNPLFEKRLADVHWYSLAEQTRLPAIIDAEQLDLVHFPHWNVPLRLKTPFVVTIHDLILLDEPRSARATTLDPIRYAMKYAGYRLVLRHAVEKSKKIIAVSNATKDSIRKHFTHIDEQKIQVIYEGVTELPQAPHAPPLLPSPYFLYVGNAYPHKNLEALLHAFSFFHKLHPEVTLVLAGRRDVFYERLEKELDEIDVPRERVRFIASPDDAALASLYRDASLYVFPSRLEGFGLPPLEAMSQGVPVAAARTSSLPEVLGDSALYFAPDDIEEMVRIMEQALTDKATRARLIASGHEQVKKFSWKTMARETRELYRMSG